MMDIIHMGISGFQFIGIHEFKPGIRISVWRCEYLADLLSSAGLIQSLGEAIETEFALLPPEGYNGRFWMGSPDGEKGRSPNEGLRQERLHKPFLIARTCITQRLYTALRGEYDEWRHRGALKPATSMSWSAAKSALQKAGLRLPTETEWEFACRAGTTTPFAFGETITPELVNYDGNYPYGKAQKGLYRNEPVDVGSLPHNGYGLFEMHGNVLEWCADWYTDSQTENIGLTNSGYRVLRGGCYQDEAAGCRSAVRCSAHWMDGSDLFGCRPAADVM